MISPAPTPAGAASLCPCPDGQCHDCQDAALYAWWDSVTEAVIKSHRYGRIKGRLEMAFIVVLAFWLGIQWTFWRFGLQ